MKKKIANWGNYPEVESDERAFSFLEDMRDYVPTADGFIPRGNGRCYGDASLASNTINTTRLDKILSFDHQDGVFDCQSGLTLDRILDVILPKGWFLPVTPGTKFITVGGAVASDVHGKNHHVDGCFSHHILEMDILLSDGSLLTCGPDRHIDLFEATCGGMHKRQPIVFPFHLPSWMLNRFTVKAFNFLFYKKNVRREVNNIIHYEPFFYPLDTILHWNRGYGKKGFVQYQFVLPLKSKQGLIDILQRINDEGTGSFLAVFKLFGPQESLIGFPMEGYTLALDFPLRKGPVRPLAINESGSRKYN